MFQLLTSVWWGWVILSVAVLLIVASYIVSAGFWAKHWEYDDRKWRVLDVFMFALGPVSFLVYGLMGLGYVSYRAGKKVLTWIFSNLFGLGERMSGY